MLLRNRMLGGVSSFALMGGEGVVGGGSSDDDTRDEPGHVGEREPSEPDDGLTADERKLLADMEADERAAAPAGDEAPPPDEQPPGDAPPAPKADAKPDADAGDDDDDGEPAGDAKPGEKKNPRRVGWATHQREVEARDAKIKELEERERERTREATILSERMAIINEALTPKAPAPGAKKEDDDPEPDREADIFAHNAWLSRQVAKANQRLDELQGGVQQQQQQTHVERAYAQDVTQFVQTTPDFGHAYNHLLDSRMRELAQVYFRKNLKKPDVRLTRQEYAKIKNDIEQEEQEIVEGALQRRESPAQVLYELAEVRGYQKAEAAPPPPAADAKPAAQNGGAPPAAQNGGGKPSVTEEIKRIKEGVEASTSLSDGGAAPPAGALSLEKLAKMSQEEFDEYANRLSDREMNALMGG